MISRLRRSVRKRSGIAWQFVLSRVEGPRWIRKPGDLSRQKVCLLASFTATGTVSRHALDLCEAWHVQGYAVVLIVATDTPSRFAHDIATTPWLAGLLVRRNIGYDFGSWSVALAVAPRVREAALLALTNDSVYGPLDGFAAMLQRVDASTADIVGVTESFERLHHLQSFLVFYKRTALRSAAFRRFWKSIPLGGREEIIFARELHFLFDMLLAGVKVDVLFPGERGIALNPTLFRWRELLDAGFPFRQGPTVARQPQERGHPRVAIRTASSRLCACKGRRTSRRPLCAFGSGPDR